MSRLSVVLLGSGVLVFTLAAGAQTWGQDQYGQPRYDPYSRSDDPNYRDRGYGYGQSQGDLIGRVMSDLNRAGSRAYMDGHERHHFDEVAGSLEDFQARLARGKFDTGKLDKAIRNLEHLAHADRVRGRDREMLTRDVYDLRQFRATRGGYGGYGYGGRYYPNSR